jgi:hypothetical protein
MKIKTTKGIDTNYLYTILYVTNVCVFFVWRDKAAKQCGQIIVINKPSWKLARRYVFTTIRKKSVIMCQLKRLMRTTCVLVFVGPLLQCLNTSYGF